MINWIDATKSLPEIDQDDAFNKKYGYSKKVLVWVHGQDIEEQFSAFATYINQDGYKCWSIIGYSGNFTITHYVDINSPSNEFREVGV